ncbi:SAM domain-containing protein SAMSN-1-like [Engraulis encrasicolus]|uniref:SAM domain-containing protein SAMSN-1-like n=1 Tax=Engraulis encrasicolus TaxID=184585 RepID=UPI002FD02E4E
MLQRAASSVSDKPKSLIPKRSASFGRFDKQQQAAVKSLVDGADAPAEGLSAPESGEPGKPGGLGKKMKALSCAVRLKMGRKCTNKSLSENPVDETCRDEGEEDTENTDKPSENSDSSTTSGVTSSSEGSSNRGSLRLEEEPAYSGPFCGRARVHTDFVPSPYDTESLRLKVGDIINVISKPPMGIWTGLLNNRVGTFKFIYVNMLIEKEPEEEEEEAPKIRPQRHSKRARPKTLLELLERLQLEEYASSLLLNGYQTVDDLKHLQEKHLTELNITDPEHRRRLLAATDVHYEIGVDDDHPHGKEEEEKNDCPRDSGCFIPSECSESKDDVEIH